MLYLYLDESGDLGFDFVNKKPSNFFSVAILVVQGKEQNQLLLNAVKKTIKRKLNSRGKRHRIIHELKATKTTLEVKKYFYKQVEKIDFGIYSITLNKRRVFDQLADNKPRVYNYISKLVMDQIPFEDAKSRVEIIIDKSKNKPEIQDFNNYINNQVEAKIDPNAPLDIYHWNSEKNGGLQAADFFCWGIFRKYERKRFDWYDIFRSKIKYEDLYLR